MTRLRQGFGGQAGDGFVLSLSKDEREKAESRNDEGGTYSQGLCPSLKLFPPQTIEIFLLNKATV